MKITLTHLFFAEWDNNPTTPKECNVGAHFLRNYIMEGFVSPRADVPGSGDLPSGSEWGVLSSNPSYDSDSWNTFRTIYWTFNSAIYSHNTYMETLIYLLLFLAGLAYLSDSSQFLLFSLPVSQILQVINKPVFVCLLLQRISWFEDLWLLCA